MELLKALFSSNDFMPHGYCYLWTPGLVWLHVLSDSLIALAYFFMPVTLVYFIRKRRDVPFHWIFLCFGAFILACGSTHAMEIWTIWHASYWLSGMVKAVTALASVPTAILLVRLVPQALALPSPEVLRVEIAERKRAQDALYQAKNELEMRVLQRTAELSKVNDDLKVEIAQRRQVEEELRRSEERFRLLVERVEGYAIFVLDPVGCVSSWNEGAQHLKGYRAEEILDRHFSCFYLPEDQAQGKPELAVKAALRQGRFEDEGWRVRKDGTRFWANVVITALRDEQGKLIGFSMIVRDLSERKQAEAEREAMREKLARMARVTTMGELTASIAHEINQPLSAVVTNANACRRILEGSSPDLDEARQAVKDIAESGMRAAEVIARIRAFLKKAGTEKTRFSINELIQEVLTLMPRELEKHKILVRTEFASGLPPVLGDRVQIQQVLLNLIMNGIEAMIPVTDRTRVLLIQSRAGESGSLSVTVRDSGAGLEGQNLEHIFDTFFTTKPAGMGMGLSISRSIIEAHGGRLWAASNESPGAAFHFTLSAA